jgi:hypothetical protein
MIDRVWKTSLLFIVGLLVSEYVVSKDIAKKYTRQECIVKVNLEWKQSDRAEIELTIKNLFASLEKTGELTFFDKMPSYVVPWKDRGTLYFQFKSHCEKRLEMAENFLSDASRRVENLPNYVVTSVKVEPHPSTIFITGEYWKN